MNRDSFKKAFDNINPNENFLNETMCLLRKKQARAARRNKIVIRIVGLCLAAACLITVVFVLVFNGNSNNGLLDKIAESTAFGIGSESPSVAVSEKQTSDIIFQNSDGSVIVRKIDPQEKTASSADIKALTEKEIFSYDTSIFRGVVTNIQNISVEFSVNGNRDTYLYAIIYAKVEKSLKGDEKTGDTVGILTYGPIGNGTWVEDSEVISQVRVGTEGIFMPCKFTSKDILGTGDTVLNLSELCGYGLSDGVQFAFIQTQKGIVYSDWTFKSLKDPKRLDDIEAYIEKMLENNKS